MKSPSPAIIGVVALALTCLNYLWLAGGNAAWVSEGYRELVKTLSLALALALFAAAMAVTARNSPEHWLKATVLTGALSTGFGFLLILASGAVLARGQFFHDGLRLGDLAASLLAVVLGGAVLAAGIGFVARLLAAPRVT